MKVELNEAQIRQLLNNTGGPFCIPNPRVLRRARAELKRHVSAPKYRRT